MEFDNKSANDGSAPSLLGKSSSIPTYFWSQILCAIFIGTGGEAVPTMTASEEGVAVASRSILAGVDTNGGNLILAGAGVTTVDSPELCSVEWTPTPLSASPLGSMPTRGTDVGLDPVIELANPPSEPDEVAGGTAPLTASWTMDWSEDFIESMLDVMAESIIPCSVLNAEDESVVGVDVSVDVVVAGGTSFVVMVVSSWWIAASLASS